jgi:ABC-2 type transport system permease protein
VEEKEENAEMLTPTRLFFIRLKQHARYIAKSVNSVLDWSVWLYLVVPMLVIGLGLYVDLWRQFPDWAININWEWPLIAAVGFLLVSAKPYIGVAEADQLLLLQNERWFKVMKQWALGYSSLMAVIRLLLLMFLLLPFLVQASGFTIPELLPLLLYSFVITIIMLISHSYFNKRGKWWMKLLRSLARSTIVAVLWVLPAYGYTADLWKLNYFLFGLMAMMLYFIRRYAATPLPYAQQLQQEQEFRMRLTGALLSQVQENKSSKRWKKPWVFRKSQRLFRRGDSVYTISELRIKALLRSFSLLQVGLTIIAAGSYAIILVDGIGALVVIVGLVVVMRTWLHLHWEQWRKEQYLLLYIAEGQEAKKAKTLSTHLLTVPALLVWLVVLLITI